MLSRGGAHPLAARVLQQLALTGHDAGLDGQALRAAWHAAALTHLDDDPLARVQSLVVLGATLLSMEATGAAVITGELARTEAERIEGPARQAALGLAALVEGMARRGHGLGRDAAWSLHEARERLVAARHAAGAAIALTELGLLDHQDGALDRALVCFVFARELHRLDGDPGSAAQLASAAAGLMMGGERWTDAVALAEEGAADARAAGDALLAAQLAAIAADCLWRSGAPDPRIDEAIGAAARALDAVDPKHAGRRTLDMQTRVRIAARRGGDADVLRQLEAAFDAGMAGDAETLIELLDWTVSHLVSSSLPAGGWALIERLTPELRARGFARVAELATFAIDRVRAPA